MAQLIARQASNAGSAVWEEVLDLTKADCCEELSVERVKLEIPVQLLSVLMEGGHLCAAQVRCLDTESQKLMKQQCLDSCRKRAAKGCLSIPVNGPGRFSMQRQSVLQGQGTVFS